MMRGGRLNGCWWAIPMCRGHARTMRRCRSDGRGAVRSYLVDEFGFAPRDIDVDGRGEDELLDPEMTDAAHSINRRVEVVLR